jgi:hypothetical protein
MIGVLAATIGIWVGTLAGPDSPTRETAQDSLVASGQVHGVANAVFENNWRTREGLISVLERMGAVAALADIATRHSKLDAQRLAIRSLGLVGNPEAQVPLRFLLKSEHRDLVVEALGLVGDTSDIVRTRALLQDERADVRRRAALALVKLAGEGAVGDLVLLLGDPHHSVRFAVFDPLQSYGHLGAQAALVVYDGLPMVGKQLALRLFGQLHYAPAYGILESALVNEPWPIQLAAVRAIGVGGEATWVPILKNAENKVSSPIVGMAIQDAINDCNK